MPHRKRIVRINLQQEKALWAIALEHFGPDGLEEVVRETWVEAKAPDRPLVEILDINTLGPVALNILQNVQTEVGAIVPLRPSDPTQIHAYSAHVQLLTWGLLDKIPPKKLTRDLRGVKLDGAIH